MSRREELKDKKRIVVKIGSSTLTHAETGNLNLYTLERLVRVLTDLKNQGKDVVLVTSGAIAVGKKIAGLEERPKKIEIKQACAAIGQASLMTVYQKLFSEYHQLTAQILITKYTVINDIARQCAENTFEELLKMGVIPIVNENDTIATDEIDIGDNDTLSAYVAAMIKADLLILLSDIDGLYTDDPRSNPDARLIDVVEKLDEEMFGMAKDSSTSVGTGGMRTKLSAATIASAVGADMVIANGKDVGIIRDIIEGRQIGTLFMSDKKDEVCLKSLI